MKKIILIYSPIILLTFLFSGCSWQEYFEVSNETDLAITVEYKIEIPENGFTLFDNKPTVYQLNSSNEIDWDKQLTFVDLDTSLLTVRLNLPKKSILIFGRLSNDHYEKHDQYFINSRVFNLTSLSINNNEDFTSINPDNFDDYFKKKNGDIVYRIK